MKKNDNLFTFFVLNKRKHFSKVYLIISFLFKGLLFTHAGSIPNVSINIKNATLVYIFSEIEKQTDYEFAYSGEILNNKETYNVSFNDISIERALQELSKQASFIYIIQNKKISIRKKNFSLDKDEKTVTGTVTDAITGQPLEGATIGIKGSNTGCVSDGNGHFSIIISDTTKTLEIKFMGYLPQEVNVKETMPLSVKLYLDVKELKEMVVNGYRKSIENAIYDKQQSNTIIDVIEAEDIAKFPQSNMAEALQRVSGIQINRDDEGGVGNEVLIRGLPPEYTQVTIDGDDAPNNNDGRQYSFNTLPAEIFNKVEVKKSLTAKDIEGGIGGTINLETKKPFDLKKQIITASAEGIYNTQQQEGKSITPKFAIAYGNKWKRVGIISGIYYHKFYNTSEGYDVTRYYSESYDLDGDGVYEFKNIRVPRPRYISQGQEVNRLSANLSVQYQLNKNLNLLYTGFYINNNQTKTRYAPIWFLPGDNPTSIDADGQFVKSISYEKATAELENLRQKDNTNNYKNSLKLKWVLGEDWKIGAKIGHAFNKRDAEKYTYYAKTENSVTYSVERNSQFFDLETPSNFSNANEFQVCEARRYKWNNSDEIFSGNLDITKKITKKINFEFGGSYRDRTKTQKYFYRKNASLNDPFYKVGKLLTGFMDNIKEAKGINEFLVFDWDKAYDNFGKNLDLNDYQQIDATYNINEKILAEYAQSDIKVKKIDLNVGVRFVSTELTSRGYELDDATQVYHVRAIRNKYNDILPCLNIKYQPTRELILRGSFDRVITRPSLQDLSSYREIDDVNKTIEADNPYLSPFRANQYDLSFEWYPVKEVALNVGLFYKDIESFISETTTLVDYKGESYELTQPVNGDNAIVKGLELGYQQPFTFLPGFLKGFGILANYTLSLSNYEKQLEDGNIYSYSLPNNSKNTFNITGYYEKYGFSFRLAYNYRSHYLREIPSVEDGLKYRDNMGITDISSSYDINKNITVTLNIINAFNTKKYEYIYEKKYMDNVSYFGQTCQIGIRVKL